MAAHVFVSHASADRPTVERVVERLDAAGIPAWASYKAIAAGSEYSREIDKSIASAQALVVLISKASNQSREVLKEVELALKYDRTVVPIIIEAGITPAGGLAYHLSPKSWIDWTRSPETAIECVVSAMCGVPHAGFARAHLAVSMAPVASDVPWCDTQSTCYERIDDASLIRPLKAGSRIGDYRVVEHIASSNFFFWL